MVMASQCVNIRRLWRRCALSWLPLLHKHYSTFWTFQISIITRLVKLLVNLLRRRPFPILFTSTTPNKELLPRNLVYICTSWLPLPLTC